MLPGPMLLTKGQGQRVHHCPYWAGQSTACSGLQVTLVANMPFKANESDLDFDCEAQSTQSLLNLVRAPNPGILP